MPRYKLIIEYDGTLFCGWQRQKGALSVQEAIERALFSLTSERVNLFAAGRTDAGVHAFGQVAHFDLSKIWLTYKLWQGLNAHLRLAGHAISILSVDEVSPQFHARFDATKRHYLYKILNRPVAPSLLKGRVWWVPNQLDAKAMHDAAQLLLGQHDFSTFRSSMCQAKNPIRHLDRLDVIEEGELIKIYASARSFLHNQVRSFAGSLKEVGTGRFTKKTLQEALFARDRARCGVVAPACGLYFLAVDYPKC